MSLLACLALCLAPAPVPGPVIPARIGATAAAAGGDPRYELGWRMKALERQWLAESDPARRAPLLRCWSEATRAFFEGRADRAARVLDQARCALLGTEPTWVDSLAITPGVRLIDIDAPAMGVEVEALYDLPRPQRFRLVLAARGWSAEIEHLPWRGEVPLDGLVIGPQQWVFELLDGERPVGRRELRFSAVGELELRLDAVRSGLQEFPPGAPSLERATAHGLAQLLDELSWQPFGETDYPGDELLAQAQACVASVLEGTPWSGAAAPGERRLWLPLGEQEQVLRLRVPELGAGPSGGTRLPLVLALHGAGGSENLFFEGYGAGAIVRLCAQRGWILVAPRIEVDRTLDVPALLAALGTFLPLDASRVFLVGHSLGALQGCAAVEAAPQAFRAVALLGGAGSVHEASAWRDLPLFLGAGAQDLGRGRVEELGQRLQEARARNVRLKIYPDSEHLTVMGDALGDVFAWFDQALASPADAR